ncbi:hypothetical protein [Pendulispora albinea]|uniref:Uncharacterized protein n=1 Tax=Pendulispora albinea TaxID=2741071 RepID=A0ABZ2LLX4_9BACT
MAILIRVPFVASQFADDPARSVARQITEARIQTALVRTLLDEVERLLPSTGVEHVPSDQLAEELARLSQRLLDVAAGIVSSADARAREEDATVRSIAAPVASIVAPAASEARTDPPGEGSSEPLEACSA